MMNDPIAKSSLLGLTAPTKVGSDVNLATPSEDTDTFREELSTAAQLVPSETRPNDSNQSNNNSSEKKTDHSKETTSNPDQADHSNTEQSEESAKKESNGSIENLEEQSKPPEDTEATTQLDTASITTGVLEDSILQAIEDSGELEDQIAALRKFLEEGAEFEAIDSSELESLIDANPGAAVQLVLDQLGGDLFNTDLEASEEFSLKATSPIVAEAEVNSEEIRSQLPSDTDSLELVESGNQLVDETATEAAENLAMAPQTASQVTEKASKDTNSTTDGSIDLSSLSEESIDAEVDELAISTEKSAIEATGIVANTSTQTSETEAINMQEATPNIERVAIGEQANLPTDRSEASSSTSKSESGPQVDPARFVTRVSKAFETAQNRGGGPIEIRLSPPELGSLQVRMEVKEGVLTASLETDNQAARNALLDNLPALRERLAEQQIRVEKFDVDVRDDSSRSDQQQQQADAQNHRDREQERQDIASTSPISSISSENPIDEPSRNITIHFPENSINVVA